MVLYCFQPLTVPHQIPSTTCFYVKEPSAYPQSLKIGDDDIFSNKTIRFPISVDCPNCWEISNPSEMNEEDEISKLPDEILCKILSFLELRLAIQSCILSKRWKLLWTFLHDLDFYALPFMCRRYTPSMDLDRFYTPPTLRRLPTDLDRRIFICFVNGVLSNRDHTSKIGKIRLASPDSVDPVFVENCIHYAASHNVAELDLDANCNTKPFRFPLNFFESGSLCKLRLRYYHASMIIPKPFSFPNLKVLYLEGFRFKDGDDFCFSKEPFSDFPDLEELTLDCCKIDDGLMILAPELKVCELIGIRTPSLGEGRILKAEMPMLKSFKFQGDAFMVPLVEEPLCLDDVYLDAFPLARKEDEALQIKLIKFMEKLKNATTLSISLETIKVLSVDLNVLKKYPSPFINLKHLKLVPTKGKIPSGLVIENVMAYLTSASSFGHSMIVEYP